MGVRKSKQIEYGWMDGYGVWHVVDGAMCVCVCLCGERGYGKVIGWHINNCYYYRWQWCD